MILRPLRRRQAQSDCVVASRALTDAGQPGAERPRRNFARGTAEQVGDIPSAAQLAGHEAAVPSGVIHGDFTRWNLLYDGGALSGVLDFEACHHNHLVADFALAWRGDHDEVIRGYDSVRPLAEAEWHLVWPTYWAWLFLGVKEMLAEHYSQPGGASTPADLDWQVRHLRKDSDLLRARCGGKRVDGV